MRQYGDDIPFTYLEAETLAYKQSINFQSLFYCAMRPQTVFSCNSIHSRYLFVLIKHVL